MGATASPRHACDDIGPTSAVLFVAFVGPKVYETYKDHIDRGIDQARSHAVNTYNTTSAEFNRRVRCMRLLLHVSQPPLQKLLPACCCISFIRSSAPAAQTSG